MTIDILSSLKKALHVEITSISATNERSKLDDLLADMYIRNKHLYKNMEHLKEKRKSNRSHCLMKKRHILNKQLVTSNKMSRLRSSITND